MSALCFGELLVDMVSPAPDATLEEAPSFLKAPGGAPANVAVALQRLGVPSRFLGGVGDDPFGHWLREVIAREGVDTSYMALSSTARTTIAFVATRSDGKKDICFYRNPGADAEFSPADLKAEAFNDARLLHCGSVSLSLEPCRAAQFAAVEQAREAGAWISFDPNWRPSLWNDFQHAHELIWRMIRLSDIVKVADEEWEFVTGTTDFRQGASLIRAQGPRLVVMTRGRDGAAFDFEGGSAEVGGFVVNAIDTLGAGDAFVGGLLTRLLSQPTLEASLEMEWMRDTLRFANACGAIATLSPGAIPGLPSREQVHTFLSDWGRQGWVAG